MKIQRIYSKNAAYQKFEVLKYNRNKRYKHNEFFVEGMRNINEAIRNHWRIKSFLYCADAELSPWAQDLLRTVKTEVNYELMEPLMEEIRGPESTSELLAIIQMRDDRLENIDLSANPVIVVFDRPSDKRNLGTVIRSCDCFGLDCLLITGHAVDLYEPDVIASAMGSFFNVQTVRVEDNNYLDQYLARLKARYPTLQIVGTTSHRKAKLHMVDFNRPTVIMIGNETTGLNRAFKEKCDLLATIPLSPNASSAATFDVSSAATVCFYEIARQRM